jgi:glucan phosphoethanolaminetransferase (alkaline phosphatase superfamily)
MPPSAPVNLLASLVIVLSSCLLIGFALTAYARPKLAERFLMSFASSARAHYLEQTFRLVMGASIVVLSPTMWQTTVFSVLGWSLVLSSIALMLLPWKWHRRLGEHVLPKLVRHMKLFAVGVFAFGALLLFALSASLRQHGAI